jgi:hypothetical protein
MTEEEKKEEEEKEPFDWDDFERRVKEMKRLVDEAREILEKSKIRKEY